MALPDSRLGLGFGSRLQAYDTFTDVQSRNDVAAVMNQNNITMPFGLFPMPFTLMIRQHYFAAVSYIDAQAGRLLAFVNSTASIADNTIIVLFGDHGWQLGERGEWAKYSTCDKATRIPLIVRTAGSSMSVGTPPRDHALSLFTY